MHHWGKVMNDELAAIAGKYEDLVGKLQERYGIAKDEAKQQIDEFKKTVGQLKKANSNLVRQQKSLHRVGTLRRKPAKSRTQSTKRTRSKSGA